MSDTTVLATIFSKLKEEEALIGKGKEIPAELENMPIKTQSDFALALDISRGYMSMLLKSAEALPAKVRDTIHEKYGFNLVWLLSNGHEGDMRSRGSGASAHSQKDIPFIGKEYTPEQTITALCKALKAAAAREEKLLAELAKSTDMNTDLMTLLKQRK